jgi:antibiotic biosynthesis monooxygenase (ABM) superfamily enzyme
MWDEGGPWPFSEEARALYQKGKSISSRMKGSARRSGLTRRFAPNNDPVFREQRWAMAITRWSRGK